MPTDKLVIDYDICDTSDCGIICVNSCPVNKRSPENPAIIMNNGKPVIHTMYCTECNICLNKCPLHAISGEEIKKAVFESGSLIIHQSNPLKIWLKKPYIIDPNTFQRFSQKNTIFARVGNDPDFENYQEGIYVNHDEILKMGKPGYSRIEMALAASSWTVHDNIPAAFSPIRLAVDPSQKFDADLNRYMMNKYEYDDIIKMTKTVKQVAISFGASLVGVTKLNRDWIYTHARDGTKNTIPDHINNVIVMAIEMDLEAIQSSPALVSGFATGNAYSRMAFAQASLAEFIRELGYEAIPAGNGTGLSVPLAIDAGLGQYGRHGLLITEEFGSNVRICKVFTNLPLEYDEPKEFGVLDFCRTCKRCAENCPSQSISHDENPSWSGPTRSNNPGILKWYVNVESCFDFWTKNGSDCSNCISSCPFTKNRHFSHGIARFVIRRLPFLNKLWVKIDHWMGYGKQRTADEFWDEDREFLHTR